jgi:5-methylcytosine-specific restriction endonuclease McrA
MSNRWLAKYIRKQEKAKGRMAMSPEAIEAIKKTSAKKPAMCIAILPDANGEIKPLVIKNDAIKTMSIEECHQNSVRLDAEALSALELEMNSRKTPPPRKPVEDMTWEERHNQVLTSLINMKSVCKKLRRVNEAYRKHITGLQETLKAHTGFQDNELDRTPDQINAAKLRRYRARCKKMSDVMRDIHAIVNGFRGRHDVRMDLREQVWMKYAVVMNMGTFCVCCHCGKLLKQVQMSVEHLKPVALGGTDDMSNLRPACFPCNWGRPLEDISHRFFTVGSDEEE